MTSSRFISFECIERIGKTNFTNRKHVTVYVYNTLHEKTVSPAKYFRSSLPYQVVEEIFIISFERSELENNRWLLFGIDFWEYIFPESTFSYQ